MENPISGTREIKDRELLERMADPKFYLEHFCKIKGKTPGLVPFILNEAQKDIFNTLRTENRVIILKARQIGFSTAITGFLYHKTIMTPGMNTVLIGYNTDMAAELLDKVKMFLSTTPLELRPTTQYNSKYEISFPKINSKIIVLPSSENVGRGYTIHACLCTELAMWTSAEDKMAAIENAVPKNGLLVIESTPRGVGNKYHRMWMAENNGYAKKEYGYWWAYDEEEIEQIKNRMNDPQRFAQEYSLEFLSSGRNVFDADVIKGLYADVWDLGSTNTDKEGEHIVHEWNGLTIYKKPVPGKVYVMGADSSEGVTGGDWSAVTFFERESGEEVAHYNGIIAPDRFGEKLNQWGRYFNNALAVVEINAHGLTVVTILKQLLYPTLYFRPAKFDGIGTPYSDRLGFKTTKVTRPLLIDDLGQALREGSLLIHTRMLLDEMQTFIYDSGNNADHSEGYHDDTIFATALALQGFKVLYSGDLDQVSYMDYLPSSGGY
jgi:hypothetical protein